MKLTPPPMLLLFVRLSLPIISSDASDFTPFPPSFSGIVGTDPLHHIRT
jgi:cytochrome b